MKFEKLIILILFIIIIILEPGKNGRWRHIYQWRSLILRGTRWSQRQPGFYFILYYYFILSLLFIIIIIYYYHLILFHIYIERDEMVTNRLDFIAFLFCSHFIERLAVPTFKNYSTGEKRNNILTNKRNIVVKYLCHEYSH